MTDWRALDLVVIGAAGVLLGLLVAVVARERMAMPDSPAEQPKE